MGVPAIVADTSAARDLVQDGHSGLWFRCGDATSLSAAIKRLTVNQVAKNMGRNANERYWKDPPTISRHILELERAYVEVLEGAAA